jgi:hypothetical protein
MNTLEHPTKLAERARYWRLHGRSAMGPAWTRSTTGRAIGAAARSGIER